MHSTPEQKYLQQLLKLIKLLHCIT